MSYETIKVTRNGPVETVALNRPEVLNAMSPKMLDELLSYFQSLENQAMERKRSPNQPRVILLKGAGEKGFCAGLDITASDGGLSEFGKANYVDQAYRAQRRISEIVLRMRRCPQPIIALLHVSNYSRHFGIYLI